MVNLYPSRLIQIDSSARPRIVNTLLSDFAGVYAALSYVWGKGQNYILSESTLHEKSAGLDIGLLPITIREAILVAQRVGFQFLWVDALYVFQNFLLIPKL